MSLHSVLTVVRLEGLEVSRVIAVRHGCLPKHYLETVCGPLTAGVNPKDAADWKKATSGRFAARAVKRRARRSEGA
jgi:hypothetical protein